MTSPLRSGLWSTEDRTNKPPVHLGSSNRNVKDAHLLPTLSHHDASFVSLPHPRPPVGHGDYVVSSSTVREWPVRVNMHEKKTRELLVHHDNHDHHNITAIVANRRYAGCTANYDSAHDLLGQQHSALGHGSDVANGYPENSRFQEQPSETSYTHSAAAHSPDPVHASYRAQGNNNSNATISNTIHNSSDTIVNHGRSARQSKHDKSYGNCPSIVNTENKGDGNYDDATANNTCNHYSSNHDNEINTRDINSVPCMPSYSHGTGFWPHSVSHAATAAPPEARSRDKHHQCGFPLRLSDVLLRGAASELSTLPQAPWPGHACGNTRVMHDAASAPLTCDLPDPLHAQTGNDTIHVTPTFTNNIITPIRCTITTAAAAAAAAAAHDDASTSICEGAQRLHSGRHSASSVMSSYRRDGGERCRIGGGRDGVAGVTPIHGLTPPVDRNILQDTHYHRAVLAQQGMYNMPTREGEASGVPATFSSPCCALFDPYDNSHTKDHPPHDPFQHSQRDATEHPNTATATTTDANTLSNDDATNIDVNSTAAMTSRSTNRHPSFHPMRHALTACSVSSLNTLPPSGPLGIPHDQNCCVAAVLGNGGSEVGVALCTLPALSISITQYGDTCTFAKTLTLLYAKNPIEVILPATAVSSELTQTLMRTCADSITFTSVQRRFFQSEPGVRRLHQLRSTTEAAVSIDDTDHYLCVAAAHALIAYVENVSDMQLLAHSVRVRYLALHHYVEIPRTTARVLHIIPPAHDSAALTQEQARCGSGWLLGDERRAATGGVDSAMRDWYRLHSVRSHATTCSAHDTDYNYKDSAIDPGKCNTYDACNCYHSTSNEAVECKSAHDDLGGDEDNREMGCMSTTTLTEALPRTCTCMGQRLLRSCLLQPLRNETAIGMRQDVVSWLLLAERGQRVYALRAALLRLSGLDLERLVATFSQCSTRFAGSRRQELVQALLDFWDALGALRALEQYLAHCFPHRADEGARDDDTTASAVAATTRHGDPYKKKDKSSLGNMDNNSRMHNNEVSGCNSDNDSRSNNKEDVNAHGADRRMRDADVECSDVSAPSCTSSAASSSPAHPTLLIHITDTLHRCQLDRLDAAFAIHLDGTVRRRQPSCPLHVGHGYPKQRGLMMHIGRRSNPVNHTRNKRGRAQSRRASASSASAADGALDPESTAFRLLRLCFALQSPVGSALDAARSGLSAHMARLARYLCALRDKTRLFTLRLEPDAVRLFGLSYAACEEPRARQVAVLKYRYAGGEGMAWYLQALRRARALGDSVENQYEPDCDKADDTCENTDTNENACIRGNEDSHRWANPANQPAHSTRANSYACEYAGCQDRESAMHRSAHRHNHGSGHTTHRTNVHTAELHGIASGSNSEHRNDGYISTPHRNSGRSSFHSSGHCQTRIRPRRVRCTTDALEVLCAQTRVYVDAILDEQVRAAQPLLRVLYRCVGRLQAMTEAVALLDMLLSFAIYASMHSCVRPVMFTDAGENAVQATGTTDCLVSKEASRSVPGGGVDGVLGNEEEEDRLGDPHTTPQEPVDRVTDSVVTLQHARHPSYHSAAQPSWGWWGGDSLSTSRPSRTDQLHRPPCSLYHPAMSATTRSASTVTPHTRTARSGIGTANISARAPVSATTTATAAAGVVPNTLTWGAGVRLILVGGPNTSGKTTLLRQTGQLFVLAQSGCFVPAAYARLCITDQIVAHMLCDELPSVSQSSFQRELVELAAMSHTVTAHSLVLIDELGRSCTSVQGFALAWATALFLCQHRRARAVMTTHFVGLSRLAAVATEVSCVHFGARCITEECILGMPDAQTSREFRAQGHVQHDDASEAVCADSTRCADRAQQDNTERSGDACEKSRMATCLATMVARGVHKRHGCAPARTCMIVGGHHQLCEGPCAATEYGVELASLMGLPVPVIREARRLLHGGTSTRGRVTLPG